MCGIAGLVDFNRNSHREIILRMTNVLHHRGPDGDGVEYIDHNKYQLAFGHRRLAIIDLSDAAHQPMQYGKLTIVFNGEIYNFREVREELKQRGHSFKTESDTEVILHAYQEWSDKCLDRLVGMFAFVVHDSARNTLFCARDRAGVKPFFYYYHEGLFMFASELKSFHQHPNFKKELNLYAVADFLQYGSVPTPHCIFNYCTKLKPGHYLRVELESPTLTVHKYWDVYDSYNKPKMMINEHDAISETEKILSKAFQYRMVSDVPVGVFLSGGYDSACVTALLQKALSTKLKTYTIGVPDIGLNEAPYAKQIANVLGTEHTEIFCDQRDAIELIEGLPEYYDEPFADSSAIPTMLISRMARKEVTVALSADAGDEIFAGYYRYDFLMKNRKRIASIPPFLRKIIVALMDKVPSESIPVLKNKYNFHNRYEKMKGIMQDPSARRIMLSLSQQYTRKQLNDVLLTVPEHQPNMYYSEELKPEFYSPLSYMMAIDYQTYLLDDILQKVDRATMSAGLEGREPFLDHHIIEWAAQLPDDYKYRNGVKKYLLKQIVHRYVPKSIMDRPKMGFAIPIAEWMMNDLRKYLDEYLNESVIQQQGIFNWSYIEKLKVEFLSGKKEFDQKIWYILMFQMWYHRWM